jgi:hypothetical protein
MILMMMVIMGMIMTKMIVIMITITIIIMITVGMIDPTMMIVPFKNTMRGMALKGEKNHLHANLV